MRIDVTTAAETSTAPLTVVATRTPFSDVPEVEIIRDARITLVPNPNRPHRSQRHGVFRDNDAVKTRPSEVEAELGEDNVTVHRGSPILNTSLLLLLTTHGNDSLNGTTAEDFFNRRSEVVMGTDDVFKNVTFTAMNSTWYETDGTDGNRKNATTAEDGSHSVSGKKIFLT